MPPLPFFLRLVLAIFAGLPGGSAVAASAGAVLQDGKAFVNHGLVGVGRVPANLRDKQGETFGSFSALAFAPGSWRRNPDGTYTGLLFVQPDRGYNLAGTTNYRPRFHKISVAFTPAPAGARTQTQVCLELRDTILFTETGGAPLTSLDPASTGTGIRPGFPALPQAHNGRLALDAEGIALNSDGTLWVSDEYGPYVYKFDGDGRLLTAIRPPEALIPKRGGADSFASNNPGAGQPPPSPIDPATGRQNNQGFEGLSLSPDGKTLFTLLQSAPRQDGGTGGAGPRGHTRLLAYDLARGAPTLKGEYVLPLPTHLAGNATRVAPQSELLALDDTRFLVLARDSNGRGAPVATSVFRRILVYDIARATNLAGSRYDTAATPLAPGGVLARDIVPATATPFIDLNEPGQLAKFGLNNGPTANADTLAEKWESLALVPAFDPAAPDDWFLFVGNDNDFMTVAGFQDGAAYSAPLDLDSMILVYRVTLPGRRAAPSVAHAL